MALKQPAGIQYANTGMHTGTGSAVSATLPAFRITAGLTLNLNE